VSDKIRASYHLYKKVNTLETTMNNKPPVEERVWAVIAHLSAIAMGMGILLPVVGWSESRRKSNYTSFQCMQALGYQSLGYTIWILATFVFLIITAIGLAAGITNLENTGQEIVAIVVAHMGIMFGLMAVYFALPVIAAIACALGKDFRYPIMGNRLAKYLGYDLTLSDEAEWLKNDNEDRWVVSMGHFAVIVMLWGMLVPVTVWILQGKRSLFLKFQSFQTVVFQAGVLILSFSSGVLYLGGSLFFLVSMGISGEPNFNSTAGLIGIGVFLASMLCMILIMLFVPLLHIMGQWAGYRILKGDEYRYPVVGRLVEKWVSKNTKSTEEEISV
jgi:uncharacterized Tic20 family protein